MVEQEAGDFWIPQVLPQDVVDKAALLVRESFAFPELDERRPVPVLLFCDEVEVLDLLDVVEICELFEPLGSIRA